MSATARSGYDRRVALDHYATPAWAVRAILPRLPMGSVIDPCAGEGKLLEVVREAWACQSIVGYELDAGRAAACQAGGFECEERDALSPAPWDGCDVIITNPPYARADAFVERALTERAPGTWVAMLLRLNWLGGIKRSAFHREHPADVFVLPRRPSFTGGGTDATEYAWFVWAKGGGGRWSILDVGAGR